MQSFEILFVSFKCILSLMQAGSLILDVAPQVHESISSLSKGMYHIETLDIDSQYSPTYVADICNYNPRIASKKFDAVFLTEVIEHVNNPFGAIAEIYRILKPGGLLFATSPLNFRIHGPLPDNWRITEHGWRCLLGSFEQISIQSVDDPNRFLFPISYRITASKPRNVCE